VCLLLVIPWALAELAARRLLNRDVFLQSHSQALSLIPGKIGQFLRNAYWHLTLARCPLDCCFSFGSLFTHSDVRVGERVYLGAYCMVGYCTIGDDTMLADHVYVLSGKHQHGTSDPAVRFQDQPQTFTRVQIGHNCWLGTNTVVMADIGDNCIIGAGSVVTKPVPDHSVAVGNPARAIRTSISDAALNTGWHANST
jgi:acetyltransferase-like isoleucine patch superfamily enzyme